MRQHAHHKEQQSQHRDGGNDQHNFQGLAGTPQMNTHKHGVKQGINNGAINTQQRAGVTANKNGNGRGGNGVLQ